MIERQTDRAHMMNERTIYPCGQDKLTIHCVFNISRVGVLAGRDWAHLELWIAIIENKTQHRTAISVKLVVELGYWRFFVPICPFSASYQEVWTVLLGGWAGWLI